MPSDNVRVTHPVEVKADARARVAFELMEHIASREEGVQDERKKREYWLTLYRQCFKAADGEYLESVLKRE